MTENKKNCQHGENCQRLGLLICDHCSVKLCIQHLKEHNEIKLGRLNEYIDQMEESQQMIDRLIIGDTIEKAENNLECWKDRAIKHINETYEFLKQKFEQYKNEINDRISGYKTHWQEELNLLSNRANKFKTDEQISTIDLKSIEKKLEDLQSGIRSLNYDIHIETRDIDVEKFIKHRPIFCYQRLNSSHQLTKSYRRLPMNQMKKFVTCNRCENILWLDEENHLFLCDRKSVHQPILLPQIDGELSMQKIIDMKWCPKRNKFLILCPMSIYSLNPKKKELVELFISRYQNLPFHRLCTLSDGSLMISYRTIGICVEHWEYFPKSVGKKRNPRLISRWDEREKQDKAVIQSMATNQIDQIGIIFSYGMFEYLEIRDKSFEKLIREPVNGASFDSIYPFGEMIWYLKDASNHYHRYLKNESRFETVKFQYPCGLQQCGDHSVIIGVSNDNLQFCDFI